MSKFEKIKNLVAANDYSYYRVKTAGQYRQVQVYKISDDGGLFTIVSEMANDGEFMKVKDFLDANPYFKFNAKGQRI